MNAYAHSVANVDLRPATDPPEDWYKNLEKAVGVAQTNTKVWTDSLGPDIGSNVPQTIIEYGNLFVATTDDILEVLKRSGMNPDKKQRQDILDDLKQLLDFINDRVKVVGDIHDKLKVFADNAASDHDAITKGKDNALARANVDDDSAARIRIHIIQLQEDLKVQEQRATEAEVGLGFSIFIGLVAVAVAVGTAGAAAPTVIGVVAVAGLSSSIATTVIYTKEVGDDMRKIREAQEKLNDTQNQAVALHAITDSTQGLVDANEAAKSALTHIITWWDDLKAKTESVQTDLKHAHDAADGRAFAAHAVKIWTKDAQKAWNQLIAFATNAQTALVTTTVTP